MIELVSKLLSAKRAEAPGDERMEFGANGGAPSQAVFMSPSSTTGSTRSTPSPSDDSPQPLASKTVVSKPLFAGANKKRRGVQVGGPLAHGCHRLLHQPRCLSLSDGPCYLESGLQVQRADVDLLGEVPQVLPRAEAVGRLRTSSNLYKLRQSSIAGQPTRSAARSIDL